MRRSLAMVMITVLAAGCGSGADSPERAVCDITSQVLKVWIPAHSKAATDEQKAEFQSRYDAMIAAARTAGGRYAEIAAKVPLDVTTDMETQCEKDGM